MAVEYLNNVTLYPLYIIKTCNSRFIPVMMCKTIRNNLKMVDIIFRDYRCVMFDCFLYALNLILNTRNLWNMELRYIKENLKVVGHRHVPCDPSHRNQPVVVSCMALLKLSPKWLFK